MHHLCCVIASTLGRARHAPALYYTLDAMCVGSVFTTTLTAASRDTAIVVRKSAQLLTCTLGWIGVAMDLMLGCEYLNLPITRIPKCCPIGFIMEGQRDADMMK